MRPRWITAAAVTVILAGAGAAISAHPHGVLWFFGVYPVPAGTAAMYQLWSGFIPALTVISLATLIAGAWHHVNCAHARCWRIGKHKVDGTPWCTRHHGAARIRAAATLEDVVARLDTIAGELKRWRSPSGLSGRNRA